MREFNRNLFRKKEEWIEEYGMMQRLEKRLGKERILYMDEAGMLAGDVYRWGWSEKGRRKYGAALRQKAKTS